MRGSSDWLRDHRQVTDNSLCLIFSLWQGNKLWYLSQVPRLDGVMPAGLLAESCVISIRADDRRSGDWCPWAGAQSLLDVLRRLRGSGGAALLCLPHHTSLHLFGSSEQPCELGRQGTGPIL